MLLICLYDLDEYDIYVHISHLEATPRAREPAGALAEAGQELKMGRFERGIVSK